MASAIVGLGSYPTGLSDLNIENFFFDPQTGVLRFELVPPTIEFPLDEYVHPGPILIDGRVDPDTGEFSSAPMYLTFEDAYGREFQVGPLEWTTGLTLPVPLGPGGVLQSQEGVPFWTGENPRLVIGDVCPPGSTCQTQPVIGEIVLNLNELQTQNAE